MRPTKKALQATVVQYITEKSLKILSTKKKYRKFNVSVKEI